MRKFILSFLTKEMFALHEKKTKNNRIPWKERDIYTLSLSLFNNCQRLSGYIESTNANLPASLLFEHYKESTLPFYSHIWFAFCQCVLSLPKYNVKYPTIARIIK
jgi:hypothetical protein